MKARSLEKKVFHQWLRRIPRLCPCHIWSKINSLFLILDPDYKCESSDTLRNVFLENEDNARSHVLEDIHTMSACVEKCCQNSTCDLALIKDDQCHLIGCKEENSCQLSHSKDVDADVTFLTNRKKQDVTEGRERLLSQLWRKKDLP